MIVTFYYESRTDYYGTTIWCEEYIDKHSGFNKFWRWGVNNKTCKDLLSSKPNMNRLMKTYLADGEIEVKTIQFNNIHDAFNGEGKRKKYIIQNNLSESLKFQHMRRINEDRINRAKLNIYAMTAKGSDENWAIVAASNLNSAIEICKSSYGESHEWIGIEIPELKLASFRRSVPGIITSRFVNRPAKTY